MDHFEKTRRPATKGAEFLKIYGITLIAAFLLMSAIRYRAGHGLHSEMSKDTITAKAPLPPVAQKDAVLPFQNLKKIFVNLSF